MRITPLILKNENDSKKLLISLGVSPEGLKILLPKSLHLAFKIENIKAWEANVIKQHLLSLGSDAAIERSALLKNITTSICIFGNLSQLRKLCQKLKGQPFNLNKISADLAVCLDNLAGGKLIFKARNITLNIKKPLVCGIINVTDDSFSGDGLLSGASAKKYKIPDLALKKAEGMIKAGAKMIDVGAESTRPFSKPVKPQEELKRVIPVIRAIKKHFKEVPLSLDTYKYPVAKSAVCEGVDMINDITALRGDKRMVSLIKKHKLGCILMHMKAKPRTMQLNPYYKDVVGQEIDFFKERLDFCYRKGLKPDQLLIDPGIGFGKCLEDNLRLINELYKFKVFGLPVFLGLSRKSFIGKILGVGTDKRLAGTISANIIAIINGADILRVHDVKDTVQAIKIASKIFNN